MKTKSLAPLILATIICAAAAQAHAQSSIDLIEHLKQKDKKAFTISSTEFRLNVDIDQKQFPELGSSELMLKGTLAFTGNNAATPNSCHKLSTGTKLLIGGISRVGCLEIDIPASILLNNSGVHTKIENIDFNKGLTIVLHPTGAAPLSPESTEAVLNKFCGNNFSSADRDSVPCVLHDNDDVEFTLENQWNMYCRNNFSANSEVFCGSDGRDIYGVPFSISLCEGSTEGYCSRKFKKADYYEYKCQYFLDNKCYANSSEAKTYCSSKGQELVDKECVSEIDIVEYAKNHVGDIKCYEYPERASECFLSKDITNKKLTLTIKDTGIASLNEKIIKLEVAKIKLNNNATISYVEIGSPVYILGSGSRIQKNDIRATVYVENYDSKVVENNFIGKNDFDNLNRLTKENYDNFCNNTFALESNKCSAKFKELNPLTIDVSKINLYDLYPLHDTPFTEWRPMYPGPIGFSCDSSKHLVRNKEGNGCECDASKNFVPATGLLSLRTPCTCKEGYKLENDSCVAIICPTGAEYDKTTGECKCKDSNAEVRNSKCECKSGYRLEDGVCQIKPIECPEGSSDNGAGICVCNDPNAQMDQGKCVCRAGFELVNYTCRAASATQCPPGSEKDSSEKCVCTDQNAEMINNACICKTGFESIAGNCEKKETTACPDGAQNKDGQCVCTDPNAQLTGARCVCSEGFQSVNGSCRAIPTISCPAGSARDITGNCVCTDLNARLTEAGCLCIEGFELVEGVCSIQTAPPCPSGSARDATGNCVCMDPKAEMRNDSCQCIQGHSKINGICLPDEIIVEPGDGGGSTGESPDENEIGSRESPSVDSSEEGDIDLTLGTESDASGGGCSMSGAQSAKADAVPLFLISVAMSLITAAKRRKLPSK